MRLDQPFQRVRLNCSSHGGVSLEFLDDDLSPASMILTTCCRASALVVLELMSHGDNPAAWAGPDFVEKHAPLPTWSR